MINARKLQHEFGYIQWRRVESLISRASNLINNGLEPGIIKETKYSALIGMGARRIIKDYLLDSDAVNLVKRLSLSYKLGKSYSTRNETAILSLLQKYCTYKKLPYAFQFKVMDCVYDFCCSNVLIEFDEPHHLEEKRQKKTDLHKDAVAIKNGYKIFRFKLHHDIIDMIKCIDCAQNK